MILIINQNKGIQMEILKHLFELPSKARCEKDSFE